MSYSLAANIWLGDDESFGRYLSVLTGVWQAAIDQGRARKQFSRIKLFDGRRSVIDTFVPREGDLDEARSFLGRRWSKNFSAWIDSTYPYLEYDDDLDSILEYQRPLTIVFNGPDFLQGHDMKRNGHVEIVFDNIGSFLVSQKLIEKAARADTTEDSTRHRAMMAQISRNYEYVRKIIRAVIAEAHPAHLLTCTESDVNPLVSHDVYHSHLEDFGTDLLRIARLHEHGGVYFCDVEPGDPAMLPPWKEQTYGYWRGRYGRDTSEELAAKLQPYVDLILSNPQLDNIPPETIEQCLLSSLDTTAERIGDSYLISSRASSQYYLEESYFCLFQSLVAWPS